VSEGDEGEAGDFFHACTRFASRTRVLVLHDAHR
jgi:hypothetical protein